MNFDDSTDTMHFDTSEDVQIQYRRRWDKEVSYKQCELGYGSFDITIGEDTKFFVGAWVARPDDTLCIFELPGVWDPGKRHLRTKRRAELYAELWSQAEELYPEREGSIPVPIAVMGKPMIAAYLFAVDELPIKTIADQLDVSEDTVRKYINRVRTDGEGWN